VGELRLDDLHRRSLIYRKRLDDLDRGVAAMSSARVSSDGVRFWVKRGATRAMREPDGKSMALQESARLGCEIRSPGSGGGSDGIHVAMGVSTLDGLGVPVPTHTLDEHIQINSLAYRGRLMAELLATLA
jgi:glutamate carboxypeptidase